MKKVGIVADNFKIEKFKSELTEKGFTNYTVVPFLNKTSTIQVYVEDDQVDDIKKLCQRLELHFKRSN